MTCPTLYAHPKCGTCQRAREWLRQHGIAFEERDIRANPPTLAELRTVLAAQAGALSRISNTSGIEYRAQGVSKRLAALDGDGALRLLASNGMFIKRPMLVGRGVALAGFQETTWAAALIRP